MTVYPVIFSSINHMSEAAEKRAVETQNKLLIAQIEVEAAQLAAYYSKARESSQVPVDYTQIKHIKKPKGGKPGMVIYHVYNTAYVTPDLELEKRLRVE